MSLMSQIQALYDTTHGKPLSEVAAPALPASCDLRLEQWRGFWRELGFHTDAPTGSSRLFELALVQSASGGSPKEMLQALVVVLGEGAAPVTPALEHFLKHLWAVALSEHGRFAAAFDFFEGGVPEGLGPGQAYAVLRFIKNLDQYGEVAAARLTGALAESSLKGLKVADVFGDDIDQARPRG